MRNPAVRRALQDIYRQLMAHYGPQRWWPAEAPFEVMVGAILTQSAAWTNVEKAIDNLKKAGALSPKALRELSTEDVAGLIRPSGYYNAKAVKLKAFVQWFGENYGDDLDRMAAQNVDSLRKQLLEVHGIGPETADSIILYATNQPVFVIDAYTRRIISRIGLAPDKDTYDAYQRLFMDNLPADTGLFNEYHALLVRLGKDVCRKRPLCAQCVLNRRCGHHHELPPEIDSQSAQYGILTEDKMIQEKLHE
ncbi:MAG: endonuclease III domain-containing protein [Chloroflexota bacterium]|nr:endonuclease III domain-containing protein [Chloroflexota bacterium]